MSNKANILIVDDDKEFGSSLSDVLNEYDYRSIYVASGKKALSVAKENDIDVALIDFRLPDMEGTNLISELRQVNSDLVCIIITGYATLNMAIEAVEEGANGYFIKPVSIDEVLYRIERSLGKIHVFHGVVGRDKKMKEIFSTISSLKHYPLTTLITGETGVGKEMIAQAIYKSSKAKEKKLLTLDCLTLPETLFETEMFGYEKGAFTGADKVKIGLLEEANGGTLFLDEIGNLPLSFQSKLLRVLEEKKYRRVGSTKDRCFDVRMIAATNDQLEKSISAGKFRIELYHRLNTVLIKVPPLRERKGDIPLLVDFLLEKIERNIGKKIFGISHEVRKIFYKYDWPGNVRELENVLEYSTALSKAPIINLKALPDYLRKLKVPSSPDNEKSELQGNISEFSLKTLKEIEALHIKKVLELTNRNIQKSSLILGISRYTLYRKLKSIET